MYVCCGKIHECFHANWLRYPNVRQYYKYNEIICFKKEVDLHQLIKKSQISNMTIYIAKILVFQWYLSSENMNSFGYSATQHPLRILR